MVRPSVLPIHRDRSHAHRAERHPFPITTECQEMQTVAPGNIAAMVFAATSKPAPLTVRGFSCVSFFSQGIDGNQSTLPESDTRCGR